MRIGQIACTLAILAPGCGAEERDPLDGRTPQGGKADLIGDTAGHAFAVCHGGPWEGQPCETVAEKNGLGVVYPLPTASWPYQLTGTIAPGQLMDTYAFVTNCTDVPAGGSLAVNLAPTVRLAEDRRLYDQELDTALSVRSLEGEELARPDDNTCWASFPHPGCARGETYVIGSSQLEALWCGFRVDVSATDALYTTRQRTGGYALWFAIQPP